MKLFLLHLFCSLLFSGSWAAPTDDWDFRVSPDFAHFQKIQPQLVAAVGYNDEAAVQRLLADPKTQGVIQRSSKASELMKQILSVALKQGSPRMIQTIASDPIFISRIDTNDLNAVFRSQVDFGTTLDTARFKPILQSSALQNKLSTPSVSVYFQKALGSANSESIDLILKDSHLMNRLLQDENSRSRLALGFKALTQLKPNTSQKIQTLKMLKEVSITDLKGKPTTVFNEMLQTDVTKRALSSGVRNAVITQMDPQLIKTLYLDDKRITKLLEPSDWDFMRQRAKLDKNQAMIHIIDEVKLASKTSKWSAIAGNIAGKLRNVRP